MKCALFFHFTLNFNQFQDITQEISLHFAGLNNKVDKLIANYMEPYNLIFHTCRFVIHQLLAILQLIHSNYEDIDLFSLDETERFHKNFQKLLIELAQ